MAASRTTGTPAGQTAILKEEASHNHVLQRCRIKIAYMPALLAGIRSKLHMNEVWLFGSNRFRQSLRQFLWPGHIIAFRAKGFANLFIMRVDVQRCWRRVAVMGQVYANAVIDAAIIEHDNGRRQVETANRGEIHSRKTERGIAFDGHHALAGGKGGAHNGPHAHCP